MDTIQTDDHITASASQRHGLGRLRELFQKVVSPDHAEGADLSSSATVNSQFWLSRFPLRPTAGWVVVAALITVGVFQQPSSIDWKALILLWLLVDPLWGAIWRFAGGSEQVLPLRSVDTTGVLWLPYVQPGSPARMLLGDESQGALSTVIRIALPTTALAFSLAFVLGSAAVWWTVTLIAVTLIAWIVRYTFDTTPALLQSLVTIVMPWMLVLALLGVTNTHDGWRILALLSGLWFVHNWGEGRVLRLGSDSLGIVLLAIAEVGISILLVATREPIWLAVLVLLWLPAWFALFRHRSMRGLNFWWLLALLVSAAAVGQSIV